jgi:hypothetical protein
MSAPPPPPPPPVPSITVNGSANAVVAEGAGLTVSVANGPGNRTDWVGLAAAGAADTAVIAWVYLSGSQTAPNAGITPATVMMTAPTSDASYEARFYVNNSYTVLTRTSFTVRGSASPPAPPPPPPAAQPVIMVAPSSPEVPDTTPLGAVVASYKVVMSDGSPFTGTVSFDAPFFDGGGVFALSGNNIIVNPTGPGLGPNMTSITDHITLEAIP